MKRTDREIVDMLVEKASKSDCTYKVSAVAFDRKGGILGHARNMHSKWNVLEENGGGRAGTAVHAERRLMERYGSRIRTILIARVGRGGELRPIGPCRACRKVADKLGIRIVSVQGSGKTAG